MNTQQLHGIPTATTHRPVAAAMALILALFAGMAGSRGAEVSLTASDALNTSSLTSAGTWSDGQPPNATNDYFTSTFFARTPTGTGDVLFAGHSLTLQAPSGQGAPMRSLIYKGAGTNVYVINNLTNAGGIINSGAGNVAAPTFTGNAMYVVSNSTIQADQGSFIIGYPLYGSADLTNTSGQGRTIYYTNDNSGFTGRFVINNNVTVAFNSPAAAPGNPSAPTPDQIDLGEGCTLLDNAGVSLTNANGGVTLEGNATINASSNTMVISEPITDNGMSFTLIKRGGGVLTLSGSNTFAGGLTLYGITAGGQLNLNSASAPGTGPFAIMSGNNALLDNTSGAPLTLTNNNPQTWSNSFGFVGSSDLDMGTGPVTLDANVTVSVANGRLSVGPVSDNGFGYSLTEVGPGTLVLNGGGSYSASTTVSNGTLVITGSGSLAGTNITLASGTLDVSGIGGLALSPNESLSGSGTVLGSVTDNPGVVISPGGPAGAGTLNLNGNLTLNGGASLDFHLSTNTTAGGGTNDLIVLTGSLNAAGLSAINILGIPAPGTYTLFRYGSFSGSLANLSVPTGFVLTNDTTAGAVELVVTHVPANLTWSAGVNNVWDTGTTSNWLAGATPESFFSGDFVAFDDTALSTYVNIAGAVSPGSVTVNATQNYDFAGGGIITGGLTKENTGTLILENNNAYPGPTVIDGGTVQVGNGGATGSLGTGLVTNNGTLSLNRYDATTMPSPIYGSGGVAIVLGAVTASGSNYYTGTTAISSGTAYLQNSDGLGATNGAISIGSGGQLYVTANVDVGPKPLTMAGAGPDLSGALRKGGAGVTTYNGAVSLSGDTTISVDGGAALNLASPAGMDGSAANASLVFAGSGTGNIVGPFSLGTGALTVNGGTWSVAATNLYSGKTVINGGLLAIPAAAALGTVPAWTPDDVTLNGGSLGATTNVTLDDGLHGITANGTSGGFNTASNVTLTLSNDVAGTGVITKSGPGTLVLAGSNSFSGTLYLDTSSSGANDGVTRIASTNALANIPVTPGSPTLFQGNNNSGFSTLQLDGAAGSINLAQEIQMACRNNTNVNLENLSGSNIISGNIDVIIGGADIYLQCDSGLLTISGSIQYLGSLTGGRTYDFQGAGDEIISGPIVNSFNGAPISIAKAGSGTVTLSAANSYGNTTTIREGTLLLTGSITSTGAVTVAGGTLAGTGTINADVASQPGGTLSPGLGAGSIGTLTINGNLALAGTTAIEVNKSAGTSDQIGGVAGVTYGGTLAVSNLSGSLNIGDNFHVFSAASASGNFSGISGSPGAGESWSFDPATGNLSVVQGGAAISSNPTNLTFTVSGNTLQLSWPADHLGWELQSNAVSLTATGAWFSVPGSSTTTNVTMPLDPSRTNVFYRMHLAQ